MVENNSSLERRVKETVKELLNNTKIYEDEDYYDIDEINTTSAIDGYNTPNAFGKKGSKNEKFKVADILKTIWLKRSAWK